jgi:hypothetical protein
MGFRDMAIFGDFRCLWRSLVDFNKMRKEDTMRRFILIALRDWPGRIFLLVALVVLGFIFLDILYPMLAAVKDLAVVYIGHITDIFRAIGP